MEHQQEFSYAEVVRRLDSIQNDVGEIRGDVKRINGSIAETRIAVAQHDVKLQAHDLELRDLKVSARSTSQPHGIVIPTDGKTLAALIVALATVLAALISNLMNGA